MICVSGKVSTIITVPSCQVGDSTMLIYANDGQPTVLTRTNAGKCA